jgi:hypothetical protein
MTNIFYQEIEDNRKASILCGGFFGMDHPALRIIREEVGGASGF